MSLLSATLPAGRKWEQVGSFFEVTRKPRSLNLQEFASVPFVPMEAIPLGGIYAPRYDIRAVTALSSGTYFERGDLLIAKITPSFENGKQALTDGMPESFGYATTEVIPVRPRNSGNDKRLLYFYLLHPEIRSYIAERMEGSTGRKRVQESVLLELPYPDMPAQEQRHIADALERVCKLKEIEGGCEVAAQALKRVAMRELFTRGLRGEAQKETEIGLVPESWAVSRIGDVATRTQYGLSLRGQPVGRVPILRMNCQDDGRVMFRNLQYVNLDEATLGAFLLNDGDLLFNRTNSIQLVGRTAIFEGTTQSVFASYLVRLTVDAKQCLPRYLNYFMNWPATQVEIKKLASRAVGQANINAAKLRTVAFPLAPAFRSVSI